MKDAADIYTYFKSLPDSKHIAMEGNIKAIVDWCRTHHPQSILEMGAGIGTLSYAALANSDARIDLYEDSQDICIPHLRENLKPFERRYVLYDDYHRLPLRRQYDLVIVDGGNGKGDNGGFKGSALVFISYLENVGTVFIEGNRLSQRSEVLEALRFTSTARYVSIRHQTSVSDTRSPKGGAFFIATRQRSYVARLGSYLWNKMKLFFDVWRLLSEKKSSSHESVH